MFSAYRRKVLAVLLLRPDEDFHVRELERLTGVPAGSLHRELKALSGAGLLTRAQRGNQVRYQANRSAPIYEELTGIFRKTSGASPPEGETRVGRGPGIQILAGQRSSTSAGVRWRRSVEGSEEEALWRGLHGDASTCQHC
jgi:DNA-binding transcriptional ArsR family regulator